MIEIDENLQIKGNTAASGGNIVNQANKNVGAYIWLYKKVGNVYCNSPDLGGFNPNCTYYVTYDDYRNTNLVKIHQLANQHQMDGMIMLKAKKWANVVTKNNGNITYWVWIPRFKYTTDST